MDGRSAIYKWDFAKVEFHDGRQLAAPAARANESLEYSSAACMQLIGLHGACVRVRGLVRESEATARARKFREYSASARGSAEKSSRANLAEKGIATDG